MGTDKRNLLCFGGLISLLCFFVFSLSSSHAYPCKFRDARGVEIVIQKRPVRVVSVVPSITEIIFKLGAGDALKGITYHSTYLSGASKKRLVGGFFSPSVKAISAIKPDVIFISKFHTSIIKTFCSSHFVLIDLETNSISESYKNILLLGRIFDREERAQALVEEIKGELDLIRRKVARIPKPRRKRVIRLMGRSSVMTPGDDSFQNEMIKAAGGIPPRLGKKGAVVPITKEEWIKFNPQVIYGCGGDRSVAKRFFNKPGWKDVDAIKYGKIFFFPCDLTCRAATNTGRFVQWLSARIYSDYFANEENQVIKDGVFRTKPIDLPLRYVEKATVAYSHIHDFVNKTLIIDFNRPLKAVSTLEGQRSGIKSVGNHYSPPPCWDIGHAQGLKKIRETVYGVIGRKEKEACFLFTGADMDNLAIEHARFRDMEVYALVTAGVKSNAVRMSADTGKFYEPGTINIIILPNMELTPRAMTRAIISATEAKTAALEDLDIRSSQTSALNQATGTGTDNIIVVQGAGVAIDNAGGHSKMGELIARAVYHGVKEAIYKQNGIVGHRSVFQRLKERKINIFGLVDCAAIDSHVSKRELLGQVEEILLDPYYASFMEAAMALSDAHERGLMQDMAQYRAWCRAVAARICGKRLNKLNELIISVDIPPVLKMSLNAILNGAYLRVVKE